MYEILTVFGSILGAIIGTTTVAKLIFYTKAEVDKQHQDTQQDLLKHKSELYEKLLESERNHAISRQEIYDRLSQNKEIFEDYMKQFMTVINEMKHEDKQLSVEFITLTNSIKGELKDDYLNRYNDLLKLISLKANESDFARMEQKVDKLTEGMAEVKTTIQYLAEEK